MSDAELRAKSFAAEPVNTDLRTALSGLVSIDWKQAFAARGFGWMTDVGQATTPIVGGGALDVFDAEQPELAIDIPTGQTFVPLRCALIVEVAVNGTDGELVEAEMGIDRTGILGISGTQGTVETPINMRSDIVGGCPLTVISGVTTDITSTPTISQVLAHHHMEKEVVTAAGELYGEFRLDYQPKHPPLIVGPAFFYAWFAGSVGFPAAGYISLDFLAIPSGLVTDLV